MNYELQFVTNKSFKKYGEVIGPHRDQIEGGERFKPLFETPSSGWLVAYLIMDHHHIDSIHCHLTSREVFDPVKGISVLALSVYDDPLGHELFLIDRPVCLLEKVWHGEMALTETAELKIIEDALPLSPGEERKLDYVIRVEGKIA